jgi:RNA polymerase sigma factor (sigma-70 family)
MSDDTDIGGARARFPATARSLVAGLAGLAGATGDDPVARQRSFGALIAAYWKPVYKHVRVRWLRSNEDAKDLTQAFFARAMEKGFFDAYDPARARFRTFLRMCLDRFVANEAQAERRRKRGGDAQILSLDFDVAEAELAALGAAAPADLERTFDREWARTLFGLAVDSLRTECAARGKETSFRLFERCDLCDDPVRPSYEVLARDAGVSVVQVTNALAWARRELRRIVLERLRELTASDEEFRSEARDLLGVEAT